MAAICTCIICHNGQQVHYFFAQSFSAEQMFPKRSMKNAWNQILLNKAVNTVGLFSQFPFHEISMGRCALFWHLFVFFQKWISDPVFWVPGKGRGKSSTGLQELLRAKGFWSFFCQNFQNNFHPILHYPLPMCLLISAWLSSALIPL